MNLKLRTQLSLLTLVVGFAFSAIPTYAATMNYTSYGSINHANLSYDSVLYMSVNSTIVARSFFHYWNYGGPCYGKLRTFSSTSRDSCRIDTISIVPVTGHTLESVTAYGRAWNYEFNTRQPWANNGFLLSSIARYKSSPCAYSADPTNGCVFEARVAYRNNDNGRMREIIWVRTPGGNAANFPMKYWIYDTSVMEAPLLETGTLWSNEFNPTKSKPRP